MRVLTCLFLVTVLSVVCFGQRRVKPAAENFIGTSLNGQKFDLSELKGKIVLVAFWSTKCPICAGEIPKLNQLEAEYNDRNVVFLGLTADNSNKVASFVKKKPFNFNLLPDSFGILLQYADRDGDGNVTMGYPAYYLINQKGEIELKTDGSGKSEKIASEINQLLKNK